MPESDQNAVKNRQLNYILTPLEDLNGITSTLWRYFKPPFETSTLWQSDLNKSDFKRVFNGPRSST